MRSEPPKPSYEFGPFRVDPVNHRLLRQGVVVPLAPKAFEVLLVLLRHRGRVVEKDELMEQLWPDSVVEEANLTVNVSLLRKALGDRPHEHRYIVTIPGRGYRLSAEVREGWDPATELVVEQRTSASLVIQEEEETSEQATAETTGAAVHVPSRTASLVSQIKRHQRGALLALAALIILVAGFGFGWYQSLVQKKPASSFQAMKVSRLTTTGKATWAAISPDGKYVAHVMDEGGEQSLWVRQVATLSNVQIVPPAEVRYSGFTFSPDGNFIDYRVKDNKSPFVELYRVPLLGGAPRKLTVDVDSPITFSPDRSRFAFTRNSFQGESALIIAQADGSGEHKLSAHQTPDGLVGPAWSPDGKLIACAAGPRTGGQAVVIAIRVDNGTERRISAQTWQSIGGIAWLSDGSGLIITAAAHGSALAQLWQVAYPGGEARRITNDLSNYRGVSLTADSGMLVTVQAERLSGIWVMPTGATSRAQPITSAIRQDGGVPGMSWTPDGKIVYGSRAGGNSDLWIMEPDGTRPKQLTVDAQNNFRPAVTPDGRSLVFVSDRTGVPHLWRMDLDGGHLKQLTNGDGEDFPDCSPDSQWVVYSSLAHLTLWKVSMQGGVPVQLTNKNAYHPRISPDGKQVACVYWDGEIKPQWQIALIPFQGGPPTKLFDSPGFSTPIVEWASDGNALIYPDTRGSISNLWSQPLAGGPPTQLTDFKAERIFDFVRSRDGQQLALSRGILTNDVVLISHFR